MADYGNSDISTTSLGVNQFPISEVYVPSGTQTAAAGGQLTALEGGPASTDSASPAKRSAPASMYVKDGGDVAQGQTTDVAVIGDNSGTLSAKVRGLLKIWTDVWDSVNHRIHVNVDNGNANGQTTMSASSPVVIASDQSAVQVKQQLLVTALAGQNFTASTGVIVTGGAGSSGLCLFNNSTAKTIIIYSITAFDQTATQGVLLAKVGTEMIMNTALPQINDNFNGGASALVGHCTYSSTIFTLPTRTIFKTSQVPTNQDTREILTGGQVIILPSGVASGLLAYMTVGATNNIGFNVQWLEV